MRTGREEVMPRRYPSRGGAGRASGLEQDERDLALGALLVPGVVAVLVGDDRPHPGALLGARDARVHVPFRLPDDGDLDGGVVTQVEEPGRVDVVAAA